MGKPTMWFPNRSDTNRAVQAQKMARDWKFWFYEGGSESSVIGVITLFIDIIGCCIMP